MRMLFNFLIILILKIPKFFEVISVFFLTLQNDILKFEEEIHLRDSLNDYFNIIHDYVKEEKMYKEYKDENEQTKIRIQIEDFIHAQLYDKIYSGMAVLDDNSLSLVNDVSVG